MKKMWGEAACLEWVNGKAITVTTQENTIKKPFCKRFAISLDFEFF